jgi:hypothetical protein
MSVIFVRQSAACGEISILVDCMKMIRVNSSVSLGQQDEGKGWRQKRQKGQKTLFAPFAFILASTM